MWLLNAGSGEVCYADLDVGRFVPAAFCPEFLRGLSFLGDYAVVGISQQRENRTFSDLMLDEQLATRGVNARCR